MIIYDYFAPIHLNRVKYVAIIINVLLIVRTLNADWQFGSIQRSTHGDS